MHIPQHSNYSSQQFYYLLYKELEERNSKVPTQMMNVYVNYLDLIITYHVCVLNCHTVAHKYPQLCVNWNFFKCTSLRSTSEIPIHPVCGEGTSDIHIFHMYTQVILSDDQKTDLGGLCRMV